MNPQRNLQCPRCLGPIPSLEHVGEYPGALSRAEDDFDIEICSACGTEEAMRLHINGDIVPVDRWPMKRDARLYSIANSIVSQIADQAKKDKRNG